VYKHAELPAKVYRVDLATGRKEFWLLNAFPPGDERTRIRVLRHEPRREVFGIRQK
jgi:hypothetical protein